MTLKPGDSYPSMNILRVTKDSATVHYTCCERTVVSRHETIARHIRMKRDTCAQCAAAAKRKGATAQHQDQPGAILRGLFKAGNHYWWPMSGEMGR